MRRKNTTTEPTTVDFYTEFSCSDAALRLTVLDQVLLLASKRNDISLIDVVVLTQQLYEFVKGPTDVNPS